MDRWDVHRAVIASSGRFRPKALRDVVVPGRLRWMSRQQSSVPTNVYGYMPPRPRIEEAFGSLTTMGWIRKVKLSGLAKVDWLFVFASAAFNLIRLPKLLPRPS